MADVEKAEGDICPKHGPYSTPHCRECDLDIIANVESEEPTMTQTNLSERPSDTGRRCAVCGAGVAAWPTAMACHCWEIPWEALSPSPAETDGIREAALEAAVAEVRAKAKFMIDAGADSGGWWLRLLSDLDTALKDTSE